MSKPYKKSSETVQPLQVVKGITEAQPATTKVVSMQPEASVKMPPPEIGCFKGRDNDCL